MTKLLGTAETQSRSECSARTSTMNGLLMNCKQRSLDALSAASRGGKVLLKIVFHFGQSTCAISLVPEWTCQNERSSKGPPQTKAPRGRRVAPEEWPQRASNEEPLTLQRSERIVSFSFQSCFRGVLCAKRQRMRVRSCFKHRRPEASRRLFLFTKRLLQQLFASTIVLMATPFLGPCLAEAPDHLLILVFDQMRPDYVERFDLPNFKSLRARSTEYPNAYVGHLASVTVVSHAVLARGLLPKELPWRDNLFWDIAGELGKANKFYDTHALTSEQFLTLTSKHPTPGDLAIRLKNKLGGRVVVVGEKHYAAMSFGLPSADSAEGG